MGFESTNNPNFKRLKIQRTNPRTQETTLATYMIGIPADGRSHINTSIWGFFPVRNRNADIGLMPQTVINISEIFARNDTETSKVLMPIIHCITTNRFTYYRPTEQAIPRNPVPPVLVPPVSEANHLTADDNRLRTAAQNGTKTILP